MLGEVKRCMSEFRNYTLNQFSSNAVKYAKVGNTLDADYEKAWIETSHNKYDKVINHIEEILYKHEKLNYWSVKALDEWKNLQYISDEEFEIARKMNKIFQTIAATNLKYINWKSDEDLSLVLSFTDFINKELNGLKIPGILRLEYDKVIKLINNYHILRDRLVSLSDKDIPLKLSWEEERRLILLALNYTEEEIEEDIIINNPFNEGGIIRRKINEIIN